MATQEERLTALEQTFAVLQKETAAHIRETDENTTIMLQRSSQELNPRPFIFSGF